MSANLGDWKARAFPPRKRHVGHYCELVPLEADRDQAALWEAIGQVDDLWTYLPDGPWPNPSEFSRWLLAVAADEHFVWFSIRSPEISGLLRLQEIRLRVGVAEIAYVAFGPSLQRSPAATEAVFLCSRHLFAELGYRRVEWKCDAANEPSRKAALRHGFQFEGLFRQHLVVKGRNRDTAWFSIIDREWPARQAAWEAWLDPANFSADGRQIRRLEACRVKP